MIGRAAVGNPWIFARRDREQVPPGEVQEMVFRHLARMLDFYGEERGLILFRKHAKRYLSVYPLSNEQRYRFLTTESPTELAQMLDLIVQ
jgi:tRNA-dihydrouridine synthase